MTEPHINLPAVGATLAAESARFAGFGWMRGTGGNLSAVVSQEPLQLVVTASGLDKGELTAGDMVMVDGKGKAFDATGRKPSAEAELHARVAALTGARSIFHIHTVEGVVAGARWPSGVELSDLEMLKGIGRAAHDDLVRIPVIQNSQDMVELGDRLEAVIDLGVPGVIVAQHGMYTWGKDAQQARHHTEIIQWLLEYKLAAGLYGA